MRGGGISAHRWIARVLMFLVMIAVLAGCGRVQQWVLRFDPDEEKTPPRGYLAFCLRFPQKCQGGGNDVVKLTRQRWAQLVAVNDLYNATIMPRSDFDQFGERERWEIGSGYGDCEDYVLAKKAHLSAIGWPRNALLIAIVDIPNAPFSEQRHAVLLVLTDDGYFVLDNKTRQVKPWTAVKYDWVSVQSSKNPFVWHSVARVPAHG